MVVRRVPGSGAPAAIFPNASASMSAITGRYGTKMRRQNIMCAVAEVNE